MKNVWVLFVMLLSVVGCGGSNAVTKLSSPSFTFNGCSIQPTGFRRATEWELGRSKQGGRIMPQDAEDGYEFFIIQFDIMIPQNMMEVEISLKESRALSFDGDVYKFYQSESSCDFSIVINNTEDDAPVSSELAVLVPLGTSIQTFFLGGNPIAIRFDHDR